MVMAGKLRQYKDPTLVEVWTEKLQDARKRLEAAREEAADAEESFRDTVRAAFDAGLSVTPIQYATGLTTSRVYQIKQGRRT